MQSLKNISVIAWNTFRESVRDKILYNIVFLTIALAFFSIVLGEWSVFDRGQSARRSVAGHAPQGRRS